MNNNLYNVITEGRYKIQPIFERFTGKDHNIVCKL